MNTNSPFWEGFTSPIRIAFGLLNPINSLRSIPDSRIASSCENDAKNIRIDFQKAIEKTISIKTIPVKTLEKKNDGKRKSLNRKHSKKGLSGTR